MGFWFQLFVIESEFGSQLDSGLVCFEGFDLCVVDLYSDSVMMNYFLVYWYVHMDYYDDGTIFGLGDVDFGVGFGLGHCS